MPFPNDAAAIDVQPAPSRGFAGSNYILLSRKREDCHPVLESRAHRNAVDVSSVSRNRAVSLLFGVNSLSDHQIAPAGGEVAAVGRVRK